MRWAMFLAPLFAQLAPTQAAPSNVISTAGDGFLRQEVIELTTFTPVWARAESHGKTPLAAIAGSAASKPFVPVWARQTRPIQVCVAWRNGRRPCACNCDH